MTDFKSYKLPGGGTLRIRSEKIIATISSVENSSKVDIYCEGINTPFHVEATKHTPRELIDYTWNIPTFEDEEDL